MHDDWRGQIFKNGRVIFVMHDNNFAAIIKGRALWCCKWNDSLSKAFGGFEESYAVCVKCCTWNIIFHNWLKYTNDFNARGGEMLFGVKPCYREQELYAFQRCGQKASERKSNGFSVGKCDTYHIVVMLLLGVLRTETIASWYGIIDDRWKTISRNLSKAFLRNCIPGLIAGNVLCTKEVVSINE